MIDAVAWSDQATRTSFWSYLRRAGGLLAIGVAVASAREVGRSGLAAGHAWVRSALGFALPLGVVIAAYAALAFVTGFRMRRMLRSQPWRQVSSTYEFVHYARGTDRDILHLSHDSEAWDLTLAVPLGRSARFTETADLLVAAVGHRSGVLSTLDRTVICWGMKSRFSAYVLSQKRRRNGSPDIRLP